MQNNSYKKNANLSGFVGNTKLPNWLDKNGEILACVEKIKVMEENMQELYQIMQDALDDAVLMGCQQEQVKQFLLEMINNLSSDHQSV